MNAAPKHQNANNPISHLHSSSLFNDSYVAQNPTQHKIAATTVIEVWYDGATM
jgi:hypothetical protein